MPLTCMLTPWDTVIYRGKVEGILEEKKSKRIEMIERV